MLILVRHSQPQIVPQVPARQWKLSAAGRRRCEPLARRVAPYRPARIFTSREPKAVETARAIAEALGVAWETAADLHEHDRTGEVFYQDRAAFVERVRDFFAHPDKLVFGRETADQAHRRFVAAVHALAAGHPEGTQAIVTHGTVMSLFVSRAAGLDPYPLWQRLGLPAYLVLRAMPDARYEIVDQGNWEAAWEEGRSEGSFGE